MIAALEEAFPATEHYVGDDGRHYWRLPSRAVAPLLTPSAEELVSLKSAITELERVDMNGEAIQLRSLERKVRALIPSDRTLRLATDEEALLEAMGERQVTVDGVTYPMAPPFMVIATQNPIEHEGTYPLPESQLDRFLMRLSLGYPGRAAELSILDTQGAATALQQLQPVVTAEEVLAMSDAVRSVHLADALKAYLVDIAETSRAHQGLALGLSPRATLQLARATRSRAAAVCTYCDFTAKTRSLSASARAWRATARAWRVTSSRRRRFPESAPSTSP